MLEDIPLSQLQLLLVAVVVAIVEGVLGIETRLRGRSIQTSKLDDESETIKVEEVSGL